MYDQGKMDQVTNGFYTTDANYNANADSTFGGVAEYDPTLGVFVNKFAAPGQSVYLPDSRANDAAAKTLVDTVAQQYASLVTLLGGKVGDLASAAYIGTNARPENGWAAMVGLNTTLNGVDIYSRNGMKTGAGTIDDITDIKMLDDAVAKAAVEAVLRALQETDLGADLNAKFDAIGLGGSAADLQAQIAAIVESAAVNGRSRDAVAEASSHSQDMRDAIPTMTALAQSQGSDQQVGTASLVTAINLLRKTWKATMKGNAVRVVQV